MSPDYTNFAPMLATAFDGVDCTTLLLDDAIRVEEKFNGHRIMAAWAGKEPVFLTRHGNFYSQKIPSSLLNLPRLAVNGRMFMLDGELVDGVLHVFDLLNFHGKRDDTPLDERRDRLEAMFEGLDHPALKLVPQAKSLQMRVFLVEQAVENHSEGVMLKRGDSRYRFGAKTSDWLKVKFVNTIDCFVTGARTDGKESVVLSVREGDGVVDIGKASLLGKEKQSTIEPGMVVEVKYLYATKDRRLFQPRIVRRRHDKLPHECLIDQLQYTSKIPLNLEESHE